MRPRALLALLSLVVSLVTVSSCGRSPAPASGVLGIVVANVGGRIVGPGPSPSPLPNGFGLGDIAVGSGAGATKLVVEPYPYGATILARATSGPEAGRVVARVPVKNGQTTFRVRLAPGTYSIFNRGAASLASAVTVRAGHYTRVVVLGGIRL
jgi:hypothetical protein